MPHRSKVVFLALAFVSTMVSARVPVEVSKEYAHILLDKTATLPGNENLGEVMYPTPSADSYFVTVVTDGPGASVETYRTVDLDRNDKSKMVSYGEVSGTWTKWFNFPAQYGTGTLVVVRPPVQGRLHARLQIVRYGTRTPEQREGLANVIRAPLDVLDETFVLPKFKVIVKPCGAANAFSSPNITVCTELIADLFQKDTNEALAMIVLHEVGHTLLNLWGLPGWDNEDVVDEFAAVLLARVRPQALEEMAKWLRSEDSISAAAEQLNHGDRHSIPVQRARNIERVLHEVTAAQKKNENDLSPTEARWFGLLVQHARASGRR